MEAAGAALGALGGGGGAAAGGGALSGLLGAASGATPWGGIAQGVGGLISGISGLVQRARGRRLLKSLQYPTEAIPQEVLQNQQLAQLRANTGLPSEQYNQAMQNIQRQQMTALNSSNDRRGGLSLLAGLQQGANDATLNLDVSNAKARLANQSQLMSANTQVANWRDKIWQNNVKDKYNRDYNYAMSLLGQGGQNEVSGLDKLATGGIMALSGQSGFMSARSQYGYGGGGGSSW